MKRIPGVMLVFMLVFAALPVGVSGWAAPAMAAAPSIVQIAAGGAHSLALFSDGSLYAWGANGAGQLGDGTKTSRKTPVKIGKGFTAIAAGGDHSLALRGNTLYAWGCNDHGQLGDGTTTDRYSPKKIGTGYTAIAAGSVHSLALKGDTLYAWGWNELGQLGDGTLTERSAPVRIGTGYTAIAAGAVYSLAIKGNILYAWGGNSYGQLGNGTYAHRNTPAAVKFPSSPTPAPSSNVIDIAIAQPAVCLRKSSSATLGVVPVTGDNSKAKLKWESSDPNTVSVTQTGKVKALKAGYAYITAAADNGAFVSIIVIVGGRAVKSIRIENPPTDNTMKAGEELKLNVTALPFDEAQGVITFKSTNRKVVSVDAAGQLKALTKGSASVVVCMGTKTVTLNLKVK